MIEKLNQHTTPIRRVAKGRGPKTKPGKRGRGLRMLPILNGITLNVTSFKVMSFLLFCAKEWRATVGDSWQP